jgi:hypothetical protein
MDWIEQAKRRLRYRDYTSGTDLDYFHQLADRLAGYAQTIHFPDEHPLWRLASLHAIAQLSERLNQLATNELSKADNNLGNILGALK